MKQKLKWKVVKEPKGLNHQKLDDAVLAMLSQSICANQKVTGLGIQAEPGLDYGALERLYAAGDLCSPPSILSDRPVWLTPKGVRRAKRLFREIFC